MGITIHYYTERGNHLDPSTAEAQFERAVALATEAAARHGWTPLGTARREGAWFMEHGRASSPGEPTRDGTGTIRSVAWDPGRGSETFVLAWVEGTGILPYGFVKTQYANQRVLVHAQLCDLLDRLNREAFDGRLAICDEGGYLPGRSLDRLAVSFGENEAAIRQVLAKLRGAGWAVSSPLDAEGGASPPARPAA